MKLKHDFKQYLLTQFTPTASIWRFLKGIRLKKLGKKEVFREKFINNLWGSDESVSGPGSSIMQTESIRSVLPGLLESLRVKVLLDAPCGDFHWMKMINLPIQH